MSCGVGCRYGSDPTLLWLWLWHRPAATALIRLAWQPPYAMGVALRRQKAEEKKRKEAQKPRNSSGTQSNSPGILTVKFCHLE